MENKKCAELCGYPDVDQIYTEIDQLNVFDKKKLFQKMSGEMMEGYMVIPDEQYIELTHNKINDLSDVYFNFDSSEILEEMPSSDIIDYIMDSDSMSKRVINSFDEHDWYTLIKIYGKDWGQIIMKRISSAISEISKENHGKRY